VKILVVASECVPFIKVGGLADVAGTLPSVLRARGHDVRVILPAYKKIDEKKFNIRSLAAGLKTTDLPVPTYFVDDQRFFGRDEVYGTEAGDYADNAERFTYFCRAALDSLKTLDFIPDVIHCNDWQTGLIPAYLKTVYKNDKYLKNIKTLFTIHNIAYQGMYDKTVLEKAGFSWAEFTPDKMEYYGKFNFLKTGLAYADIINTVSPSYSWEILTKKGGMGMDGILNARKKVLYGVLNGIDYEYWNPKTDKLIPASFSKTSPAGKKKCKKKLRELFKFKGDETAPLIGCVSRIDFQKGYDLVLETLLKIIGRNFNIAVLGKGSRDLQDKLAAFARQNSAKVGVAIRFDEPLGHQIYAGSDIFLMPSRYEPCGLGQMIALAYGTIPVVHKTGGLGDTVKEFNKRTGKGNGFVFNEMNSGELEQKLAKVFSTYDDAKTWEILVNNAFESDFSWAKTVEKYEEIFKKAVMSK
jgi:starch synthase